ncbi:hypothetical protein AVEN_128830-1 [Araneus ventricosus]|uniref:Uncharacterized protein n=1 Tax=Araneus ventricosus TaxID=182803 RepID=A0A4Y2IFK8_ARAVE|nr:hypothetical protein AVEN_128830-1 [Araneus ventricosus]
MSHLKCTSPIYPIIFVRIRTSPEADTLLSSYSGPQELLGMGLVIFNCSQITRTKVAPIAHFPNFCVTSVQGSLSYDFRFSKQQDHILVRSSMEYRSQKSSIYLYKSGFCRKSIVV